MDNQENLDNSNAKNTKDISPESKKTHSDLYIRLRSGLIYAIIVLTGSLINNISTMIMVSITAGICAFEFCYVLHSDAKLPNETIGVLGAMSIPVSFYFFGIKGVVFVIGILILALLLWYILWLRSRIIDVGISFFGAIYSGFMLTCLLALRISIPGDEFWGGLFVVFLLTTVSLNDGFAYVFGKKFGKHRLAPQISPKKTWEGFIAGLFFSVSAWCVLVLFPGVNINIWQCILFGFLCAIAGVIGDLVESRMKRNSGVKDSGNIMPGHGGLLDRLDSVFLVSLTAAMLLFGSGCIPYNF